MFIFGFTLTVVMISSDFSVNSQPIFMKFNTCSKMLLSINPLASSQNFIKCMSNGLISDILTKT